MRSNLPVSMRVAFLGNHQIQALCEIFSRFAALHAGHEVRYFRSSRIQSTDDADWLQRADLVVGQLTDNRAKTDWRDLGRDNSRLVLVPLVSGEFLWPHAGISKHPSRSFAVEYCDDFLNRQIASEKEPDAAAEAYLDSDIVTDAEPDRLLELNLEQQHARDKECGYRIANVIATHFPREQLFFSRLCPGARLLRAMSTQLFEQLKVPADRVRAMQRGTYFSPFSRLCMPIHPKIGAHFQLEYATPERAYRCHVNDSVYTFREWCVAYVGQEQEALARGIALSRGDDVEAAERELLAGLSDNSRSPTGHMALANVRRRQKRIPEALASAAEAIRLDPHDPLLLVQAAGLYRHAGEHDRAREMILAAMTLDPDNDAWHAELAQLATLIKSPQWALFNARRAVELQPFNPRRHVLLGDIEARRGCFAEAEKAFQAALDLQPSMTRAKGKLAEILERRGSWAEAARLWHECCTAEPQNDHFAKQAERARNSVSAQQL